MSGPIRIRRQSSSAIGIFESTDGAPGHGGRNWSGHLRRSSLLTAGQANGA